MELVKVKFKGEYAYIEKSKVGTSRADVGLAGVWELYKEEPKIEEKKLEPKKEAKANKKNKPKKASR